MSVFGRLKYCLECTKLVSKGFFGVSNGMQKSVCTHPIDIVVTWVNGSDLEWQAEKNKYLKINEETVVGNGICRYREWEFFKYWFRSIEKYAPWVNCVFFVTCGHVPKWLDVKSPKLRVVKHDEFIPKEYLPTFSSIPIEMNLHRIKGLSEHFIYFNDDIFLSRPSVPSDFFVDGKPVLCPVPVSLSLYKNELPLHIMCSTYAVINSQNNFSESIKKYPQLWFARKNWRYYKQIGKIYQEGSISGMYFSHMAVPFKKSTFGNVWKKYKSILEITSTHKFRTPMDIMHAIFSIEDILNGNYYPCGTNHYGKLIDMEDDFAIRKAFLDQELLMMCFNDSNSYTQETVDKINASISEILEKCFPDKSSFERND